VITAVPPPDPAQLARGHELGVRIDAIAAEVRAWAGEVDATNADRRLRVQTYSGRVLAALQSARTDLCTLALVMAEGGGG